MKKISETLKSVKNPRHRPRHIPKCAVKLKNLTLHASMDFFFTLAKVGTDHASYFFVFSVRISFDLETTNGLNSKIKDHHWPQNYREQGS